MDVGYLLDGYLRLLEHQRVEVMLALQGEFTELLELLVVYAYAISMLWTLTSLVYIALMERRRRTARTTPTLAYSVLIPFHAEPMGALRTAQTLVDVKPAPSEIILVDDGSEASHIKEHKLPQCTRLVCLQERQGKAGALKAALELVETPLVVCLDADTRIRSTDWHDMLATFEAPELGAVTGKIWPHSNGSLTGSFQELDYLAVISLIKAAESTWGGLMTVSGAFVAYRVAALRSVGGFDVHKATEDIDVSWRLQLSGWRLAYCSQWTAAVEMAPNFKSLWRQRRRWSSGLGQALRNYGATALLRGSRHLPIVLVTLCNVVWMAAMLAYGAFTAVELLRNGEPDLGIAAHISLPAVMLWGIILFALQFAAAALIDGRSWRYNIHLVPLLPLYPVYFWSILLSSFLVGFPTGLTRRKLGIWQPTVRAEALVSKARKT